MIITVDSALPGPVWLGSQRYRAGRREEGGELECVVAPATIYQGSCTRWDG
jgi:hypothetical protein